MIYELNWICQILLSYFLLSSWSPFDFSSTLQLAQIFNERQPSPAPTCKETATIKYKCSPPPKKEEDKVKVFSIFFSMYYVFCRCPCPKIAKVFHKGLIKPLQHITPDCPIRRKYNLTFRKGDPLPPFVKNTIWDGGSIAP